MSKKKKVPKFVLAKNEAAKAGVMYVVHTQDPPFIGELHRFDSLDNRTQFIEENPDQEVLLVNPTTLLIVHKYFNTDKTIADFGYLQNKIIHWVLANYVNSNAYKL
jgi:hypothetical protein